MAHSIRSVISTFHRLHLCLYWATIAVLTVWASQTRFYCRDTGTKNMIIFAQDSAGNIAKCTTRVTIIDTLRAKIVNCPRDTTFRLGSGECGSPKLNFPTPTAVDNCQGTLTMVQKSGLPSGSSFPTGTSTLVFETANAIGTKYTCSFRVSVGEYPSTAGTLLCQTALDVGIAENCQSLLTARDLLANSNLHCLADYKLTITYGLTPLLNNVITSEYIGKTLKAQVIDLQTNSGCQTALTVRDLSAPRLAPPADVEVACYLTNAIGSTPMNLTGAPRILAECSTTTTSYNDTPITAPTCEGTFSAAPQGFPATLVFDAAKGLLASRIVIRDFSVVDASGNVGKTQQVIYVRKTALTNVTPPANLTFQCGGNGINTSPDSVQSNGIWLAGTGRPTFPNGIALANGSCKIGSSFSDVKTKSAMGYYITRTWTIGNSCTGEVKTYQQLITVNDKAPVITCKPNYAAILATTTNIAKVPALDVVNTLTDECTPRANLMVRIQRLTNGMPWPDSAEVTFNCNDIGTLPVEILVKDESGLMSKCQTTVQISDPNRVCRAPTQPAVFGIIETAEKKPIVSNVVIQSASNPTIKQMTRSSRFSFFGMPRSDDWELTPTRDSDALNGVSTYDIALMSRHILGDQPLTSALKQIAADVNADGAIDAVDMIITRRLVLQEIYAFPSNKSWRFVPKVYQFPSAANTIPATNFPDFIAFVNLNDTMRTADFWAIKTGDLNGSASGNSARDNGQVELRGANQLIINANNEFLEKDKTYDIELSSDKMEASGFQFTLNFDKNAVKILSIEQADLPNFNQRNYALFPSQGKATVSWNGNLDKQSAPMNLLRLRVSAKQSARLSDVLRLTSDLTAAEAFSSAGETSRVELQFKGIKNNDFNLFQNEPNPTVGGQTNIRFRLPEASEAKLTLYDISGKVLQTEMRNFEKGDNNWRISTPSVSGVVLYRLDTPTHSATRRMVIGQ
jgi:Dockerin type I domain/HYR domain